MTRQLTPGTSALHLFGTELRTWRKRNDLSQKDLAEKVPCSASQIGRVEKAERWPTQAFAEACDTALGTTGILSRMWPAVDALRRQHTTGQATTPLIADTAATPITSARSRSPAAAGAQLVPPATPAAPARPDLSGPDLAPPAGPAYRRDGDRPHQADPDDDRTGAPPGIEHEVAMTAHDSSHHAEGAERRDIGEATLEQLRADVTHLARDFVTAQPLTMFRELRRVRDRITAALDRRLWPHDQTDLYFLLGCVHNLLAVAANYLGHPRAGEEFLRAGWAYATVIDHRPLMARLRFELASHAHWQGRYRECRALAASGLAYLADGQDAAALHLLGAEAAAKLGDTDAARRAITAAHEAREREQHNELLDIGGEFGLSRAGQHYLAGSALIELPDTTNDAVTELEQATTLYTAGPEPGEWHSFEYRALAHIDLAAGHLRASNLDAATTALEPALSLPADQRVDSLNHALRAIRAELATPTYHGNTTAADLDERIEQFTRHTVMDDLADLNSPAS